MAHHKSATKRIKTNKVRNLRNRYERKTLRTLVKKVRLAATQEEGSKALGPAISRLDKAARKGLIHKKNAARNKSRLTKFVRSLSATKAAI